MTFIFDGVKVQTSYFPEVLIIFMQIPQAVTAVTQQRPKRFLGNFSICTKSWLSRNFLECRNVFILRDKAKA